MLLVVCASVIALVVDFILLNHFPWIALGLNSVVAACLIFALKEAGGEKHPLQLMRKKSVIPYVQIILSFPVAISLASAVSISILGPSTPWFQLVALFLIMQVIAGFVISSLIISASPSITPSANQVESELLQQSRKTQH